MTEQNNQFHTEVFPFEFRKKGATGVKKDGTPFQAWELNFSIGGKYPFRTSAFDSIKEKGLAPQALVEGEWYEISYTDKPYVNSLGRNCVGHNVFKIVASTADKSTVARYAAHQAMARMGSQVAPEAPKASGQSVGAWDAFVVDYNQSLTEAGAEGTPQHMLWVYITNFKAEEFKEIIEKCKQNFKSSE